MGVEKIISKCSLAPSVLFNSPRSLLKGLLLNGSRVENLQRLFINGRLPINGFFYVDPVSLLPPMLPSRGAFWLHRSRPRHADGDE